MNQKESFRTYFIIQPDSIEFVTVYGQSGTLPVANQPEQLPLLEKLIRKFKLPTPYLFLDRSSEL